MYEPAHRPPVRARRTPQRHTSPAGGVAAPECPSHQRRQLAGHLAALLAVTRRLGPAHAEAAGQLADRIAELAPGGVPVPGPLPPADSPPAVLHAQAQDLAARVLVVAAAQQDTTTARLACARMDAHGAARDASG